MPSSFRSRDAIGKATYNPREFRHASNTLSHQATTAGATKRPRVWTAIFTCCAVASCIAVRVSPDIGSVTRSSHSLANAPRTSTPQAQHVPRSEKSTGSAFEAAWLPKIGTVPRCAKLRQRVHELAAGSRLPSAAEVEALWREVKRNACNMVP